MATTSFGTGLDLEQWLRFSWDYCRPGAMILLALGLAFLDARGIRSRRWTVVVTTVAWLLLAWVVWTTYLQPRQHPGRAARGAVRAGNAFHYALGARYLSELGYTGLYPCALAAWLEQPELMAPDPTARDLTDYTMRPASDLAAQCDRTWFTPARWEAFRKDVAAFVESHPGIPDDEFRAELRDKGFNPPPTWALVVGPLISGVDLASAAQRWILALPDMLVFAGVLGLASWRLGALRGALVGLFLVLYFGTFRTLLGNVGQYLWWLPLAGAVLAVDARRMRLGGVLLGVAAAMQVFPLVFASVPAIRWAAMRVRGRPDSEGWGSFLTATAATAGFLGIIAAVALGPGVWSDFASKMTVHTRYLSGELFDIGWRNAVATAGTAGMTVAQRLDILDGRQWVTLIGILLAAVAWGLASLRSGSRSDIWSLGFVPFYFLTVASPYYYLALAVLVLDRRGATRVAAFCLLAAHFPLWAYADRGFVDPENWPMHAWSEALMMLLLALLVMFVFRLGAVTNPESADAPRPSARTG